MSQRLRHTSPAPYDTDLDVAATLSLAVLLHEHTGIQPPTDHEIEIAVQRAYEADISPVTPERILQLNQTALDYYTRAFPGSWAQNYLTERLRQDITGHPTIQPGC